MIGSIVMPANVEGRVETLVRNGPRFAYESEAALRTILRLFLQGPLGRPTPPRPAPSLPERKHRVEGIETALMPVRQLLPRRDFDRLVSAMTLCLGIEAALLLRDLRGLSQAESIDVCCWAAKQLVRAALRQAKKP